MKRSIKVITTSIKGGVGKTQICATQALYMVEKGIPVKVIDADIQQSLSRHRQRDLEGHPDEWIPYSVDFLNTTDINMVKAVMDKISSLPCCFLIDCPGNISDPALSVIYRAADYAVIPFELNADSVDATVMFAEVFKANFSAKMYFVPNKVSPIYEKRGEVRKAREDAEAALGKLGIVTPDIKMTTHLNGYSTLDLLDRDKRRHVLDAFHPIVEPIWKVYNR